MFGVCECVCVWSKNAIDVIQPQLNYINALCIPTRKKSIHIFFFAFTCSGNSRNVSNSFHLKGMKLLVKIDWKLYASHEATNKKISFATRESLKRQFSRIYKIGKTLSINRSVADKHFQWIFNRICTSSHRCTFPKKILEKKQKPKNVERKKKTKMKEETSLVVVIPVDRHKASRFGSENSY